MATDRLNNLKTSKTISIKKYFGEMELGEYSRQRRIDMASQMEEFLIVMLSLMRSDIENGREIDKEYYSGYLQRRYEDAVTDGGEIDPSRYPDVENRIKDISPKIIESTINNGGGVVPKPSKPTANNSGGTVPTSEKPTGNGDEEPRRIEPDDNGDNPPYFFSPKRATHIAEEEANTIVNMVEFKDAKDGGKQFKTWHTMRDSHVRQAHYEAEGQKVKIDDYFEVMGEHLRFPRDVENGSPDNIDGCRCTVSYS